MAGSSRDGRGTVLVTGGSRGIGAAVCRKLAADGYAVAVNYARNERAARDLVAEVGASGGRAAAIGADIGDPGAIGPMFEAACALGPLAALVNNAGITGRQARIDEQDADGLGHLLSVNLLGPMLCAGEAVRRLSTRHGGQGGTIVNISSVAARLGGVAGLAAYAATKGAIESFTRGIASEVGREGIRVVAVAPGVIETDMSPDSLRELARANAPLGRPGRAEEVAEAVAWLLSDAASYVTGTTLTVSGGR